ncbi:MULTISPECIES: transcription factor [Photorhabdus]|uniref:Transcription factor n=1 Tax=Photorhabdus bodei TaxID=2029681 RepID=A0A329X5X6_9GAMM|nr:transcription factor [Photorhabdus bodei]NDL00744.1 transcription factor [Photorhabdus bodei]NDL04910.1 transcription factor [Photorhabdus bodei]NDL09243.1 transcription factor [Photorhabdus bodei]RAX12217.1 transcription factor [Photorhabdus bodei]
MSENEIYRRIKLAFDKAPRNQFTVELHLQMLKHADELKHITAREFCEGVSLHPNFDAEFSKMRNLTSHLKAAGLDTNLL